MSGGGKGRGGHTVLSTLIQDQRGGYNSIPSLFSTFSQLSSSQY